VFADVIPRQGQERGIGCWNEASNGMRRRRRGWVHYGFSRVDTPPAEFRGGRQHGVAMEAPTAGGMVTLIATAYEGDIYPSKRAHEGGERKELPGSARLRPWTDPFSRERGDGN